jgi:hypothetical protein
VIILSFSNEVDMIRLHGELNYPESMFLRFHHCEYEVFEKYFCSDECPVFEIDMTGDVLGDLFSFIVTYTLGVNSLSTRVWSSSSMRAFIDIEIELLFHTGLWTSEHHFVSSDMRGM